MTPPFTNIHALIIDMDGVLWHGNQAVSGLKPFFQLLRKKALPFILATNNASHTNQQYIRKLANMGITVSAEEILTSGMATASYLAEHYEPENTRIFVLGEDGARAPLLAQGFTLTGIYELKTPETPNQGADIVVCGKDETLNWDKLSTATLNLHAGAKFIATNADVSLPTERGFIQGNGAILAALHAATGRTATTVGKPEPIMYQQALKQLGTDKHHTVAIGDRLETDILGAINAGMRSILVLSGISTVNDIKDYTPTWILDDLNAVTCLLEDLDNHSSRQSFPLKPRDQPV